jgi:TldD protein
VDGIYPDSGIHDCIIGADLAGILAHEAIGHTTEADLVLAGSVAANLMDQEVASPLVTLVDFAHTAYGKTCPVPVYVDDEGVKAEDAMIIEKGILKSYMHNKDSAQKFQMPLTGNARAMQFYDEPLIRMRNTAILPGKSQLKEMIASIDDGYYLMKSRNGQADSTSEFMFGVVQGYEVKNGKLGRALKDITISGIAFDVLKSVSRVWEALQLSARSILEGNRMKDTDIVDYCVNGLLKTGFEKASVHFKSMEKTELNVEHNDTNLLRTAKEITLSLFGFVDQKSFSRSI